MDWPMDETSTSSLLLSENLLRVALKSKQYDSPADKTLDFIRNFANSFRIVDGLPLEASSFSLS